jgi:hypothetical protein
VINANQNRENQEAANKILDGLVRYCHLRDLFVVLILVLNKNSEALLYLASEMIALSLVTAGQDILAGETHNTGVVQAHEHLRVSH